MNGPSYQEIVHAREFLEDKIIGFPEENCSVTSKFLSIVFPELKEIAGRHKDSYDAHAWNYYRLKNKHMDLTMDQFDKKYNKVEIITAKTILLIPSIETTVRQKLKDPRKMNVNSNEFDNVKKLAEYYKSNYHSI